MLIGSHIAFQYHYCMTLIAPVSYQYRGIGEEQQSCIIHGIIDETWV
jgi:hypothetical protein